MCFPVRETEGEALVDQVLQGCQVIPWSFTKAGGGQTAVAAAAIAALGGGVGGEEAANSIKIVLGSELSDQEMGSVQGSSRSSKKLEFFIYRK
jgi:hypothetical protein